ncbi:hypothetical protein D3C80_1726050 [compost metagenome]
MLALAIQTQVPPPPPGFALDPPADMPPSIQLDGWFYMARSADRELYMLGHIAHGPGQLWVRYEYLSNAEPYRSLRLLREVDCTNHRARTIQSSGSNQNNMKGQLMNVPISQQWEYAAPGTFSELQLSFICPSD